jgi:Zn finger protein HypA/HybF involved in hydrogenase expression
MDLNKFLLKINATKEQFVQIAEESFSIADILRKLNVDIVAKNYRRVNRIIKELKLNTSHFTGQGWNKGNSYPEKTLRNIKKYLNNEKTITSNALKKLLIKFSFKERKCEKCGLTEWQGFLIPLELHHKDGNHQNNHLENLEILCPNCHSLQPTYHTKSVYGSKNISIDEYKDAIESSYNVRQTCLKLGIAAKGGSYEVIRNKIKKYGFKFKEILLEEKEANKIFSSRIPRRKRDKKENKYKTLTEAIEAITKGKYPSNEQLLEEVWNSPLTSLANIYGVSPNSIKKYCRKRNIPVPPTGYWNKYKCGHSEECTKIKENLFLNWTGIKEVKESEYFGRKRRFDQNQSLKNS